MGIQFGGAVVFFVKLLILSTELMTLWTFYHILRLPLYTHLKISWCSLLHIVFGWNHWLDWNGSIQIIIQLRLSFISIFLILWHVQAPILPLLLSQLVLSILKLCAYLRMCAYLRSCDFFHFGIITLSILRSRPVLIYNLPFFILNV